MNWNELTTDQKRAASAAERRLIVFGGAGSGKTTVALWCAREFLRSEAETPPSRVLFLTFSRTAVRELARRSGRVLADVQQRVEIQTFHSIANRLLNAFGRYAGLGKQLPPFRSNAEAALLGRSSQHLSYDDLVPLVLKVVRTPRIKRLLSRRWPLVICDEFQDTDDLQWELLCELATVRLVMLADPNQLIYDFLSHRGVGPRRVEQAMQTADFVIDLGVPSHRDPSNIIPAMAAAVRQRQFDHPAVAAALRQDRLRIHDSIPDQTLLEVLRTEVEAAWAEGRRSVGIFGHSNQSVAELSTALFSSGVKHALVGLPEAECEALNALETLCLYGVGQASVEEVRLRLAVFITASVRSRNVPQLAILLHAAGPLPPGLERSLDAVLKGLLAAGEDSIEFLVRTAVEAWPQLGIAVGRRVWKLAARSFVAIAGQLLTRTRTPDQFFMELRHRISEYRAENLFDLNDSVSQPLQLMNFHQTKGREADVVILVYRNQDWFGSEQEPFPTSSRLLYVSLTRARSRNVVILPSNPHPLVAPFSRLIG